MRDINLNQTTKKALAPRLELDRQRAIGALLSHWTSVVKLMNREFVRMGVPVSASFRKHDAELAIDNMHCWAFAQAAVAGRTISGMMHDTQIITLTRVVESIYRDPTTLKLVIGSMMCGKTGTANSCKMLGPIFYTLTGGERRYYPIIIPPPRKGSMSQTENEMNIWEALYGNLQFVGSHGVDAYSSRRYESHILHKALEKHRKILMQRKGKGPLTMRGRARANIEIVRQLCLEADKDNFTVILIDDEPHWGSATDGVQDKMMESLRSQLQSDRSPHTCILLDATPFTISNAARVSVIYHKLSRIYSGPNCWNGVRIDDTVETRQPFLPTFDEFFPGLGDVSRSLYVSPKAYKKWATKNDVTTSYDAYRRNCVKKLREVIHHVLLGGSLDPRTRGLCLRFHKSNTATRDLMKLLKLDNHIKCVSYFGNAAQDSISDVIELEAQDGPYIVFVTGAARMAEAFPHHCTHFIDFTDKVGDGTALMQGSFGRACGNCDPRTVVMNDHNINYIKMYLSSMGRLGKKPHSRASMPSSVRPGRPEINMRLRVESDPEFFGQLTSMIVKHGFDLTNPKIGGARSRLNGQYVPFWELLWPRLDNYEAGHRQYFPDLLQRPHALRPGEDIEGGKYPIKVDIDPKQEKLPPIKQTCCKLGFRGYSDDSKGAGQNFRGASRTSSNDGSGKDGRYAPQIWMKMAKGVWQIDHVVLRLKDPVLGGNTDYEGQILATDADMYHRFQSRDQNQERAEREQMRESRRG